MSEEKKLKPPKYVLEQEFDLPIDGNWQYVGYQSRHPSPKVIHVRLCRERNDEGRVVREYGALTVLDRGYPSDEVIEQTAVLVRRSAFSRIVPIPEEAGRLLGTFESDGGRHLWYLFDFQLPARERASASPPAPDKKTEEPPSPALASASVGDSSKSSGSPPGGRFGFLDTD